MPWNINFTSQWVICWELWWLLKSVGDNKMTVYISLYWMIVVYGWQVTQHLVQAINNWLILSAATSSLLAPMVCNACWIWLYDFKIFSSSFSIFTICAKRGYLDVFVVFLYLIVLLYFYVNMLLFLPICPFICLSHVKS